MHSTKQGPSHNRKVVIGLDGVPSSLIADFTEHQVMPNTKELINSGTFAQMKSSLPEVSSVSWSSIITGKNPGEHGIFGFTHIMPGTYTISFPNFQALKAKPFWHQITTNRYVIINIPFTYPAEALNGCLISGFVAPELEDSVYPKTYLPKLKALNYQVDIDSAKAHKSKDLFLRNLFKVLQARIKTYRFLWDEVSWDLFMFVITGTDRLMHFLWDAYIDQSHKYHPKFIEFFRNIDEVIGEIASRLDQRDSLYIISDHGFEAVKISVYLNAYLQQNDLLNLDSNSEKKKYNAITKGTKAFALDPGRIYLNWKNEYPNGSVKEADKAPILRDLTKLFKELQYENEPVINKIFPKEEIYTGPHLESAPDLVLLPNPGYSLKGKVSQKQIFDEEVFTGMHAYSNGIFISGRKLDLTNYEQGISVENVLELTNIKD